MALLVVSQGSSLSELADNSKLANTTSASVLDGAIAGTNKIPSFNLDWTFNNTPAHNYQTVTSAITRLKTI